MTRTRATFGRIDIVVNAAGTDVPGLVADLAVDDCDPLLAVNRRAPFVLANAVFPHMQQAGRGTFNVFEAARAAGVTRLVLCSTMGVYGESARPPDNAWGIVTEELPCLSTDIYGISKRLCEELARDYGRRWGVVTVALWLGMFVPETFAQYGFRLLFGDVDDHDVAQAVMRAPAYAPPRGFDAFNIMAEVPFTLEDDHALHEDPVVVLERYYPGVRELAQARGLNLSELI